MTRLRSIANTQDCRTGTETPIDATKLGTGMANGGPSTLRTGANNGSTSPRSCRSERFLVASLLPTHAEFRVVAEAAAL